MSGIDAAGPLKEFQPKFDFFIGIDSDGCVFDTMEIKQKECFTPNTVKHWRLQAASKYVRETAEFVNLYSCWRGVNRFPALVKTFDFLSERQEVIQRGVEVPRAQGLRDWIDRETKLGNPALKAAVEQDGDEDLKRTLAWSLEINATIAEMVEGIPPFPYVRESLAKLNTVADAMVVSQTPLEALVREWEEHGVDKEVEIIAGQEMGTKSEHIRFATAGKYEAGRVLMIGDAPGDMKAARDNEALFYPINPGEEEQSWQRFYEEGLEMFLSGRFGGDYEAKLIEDFNRHLPSVPPWRKGA